MVTTTLITSAVFLSVVGAAAQDEPGFRFFQDSFEKILGPEPKIELYLENEAYPWAHEACVYLPSSGDLYITSNRIKEENGEQRIQISKVTTKTDPPAAEEIDPDVPMANGGVNYEDGVLFCSQGTPDRPGGLVLMNATQPYSTTLIVSSFHARNFNSPNDVVVHRDGSLWFTDPIYGYEQGFRPPPQLPNQVYRYDPAKNATRVMADGFGRPNGISFSPDQSIVYITDTEFGHGDGNTDLTRASTM